MYRGADVSSTGEKSCTANGTEGICPQDCPYRVLSRPHSGDWRRASRSAAAWAISGNVPMPIVHHFRILSHKQNTCCMRELRLVAGTTDAPFAVGSFPSCHPTTWMGVQEQPQRMPQAARERPRLRRHPTVTIVCGYVSLPSDWLLGCCMQELNPRSQDERNFSYVRNDVMSPCTSRACSRPDAGSSMLGVYASRQAHPGTAIGYARQNREVGGIWQWLVVVWAQPLQ